MKKLIAITIPLLIVTAFSRLLTPTAKLPESEVTPPVKVTVVADIVDESTEILPTTKFLRSSGAGEKATDGIYIESTTDPNVFIHESGSFKMDGTGTRFIKRISTGEIIYAKGQAGYQGKFSVISDGAKAPAPLVTLASIGRQPITKGASPR